MKQLLCLLAAILMLGACNRPRVHHNFKKHMPKAMVAVDSARQSDFYADEDTMLQEDEALFELPKEPEHGKAPANVDEQIERMMMGEDVPIDE